MEYLTSYNLQLFIACTLGVLGTLFITSGLYKLLSQGTAPIAKYLRLQTARLQAKGLIDDPNQILGTIGQLTDAIDRLVRTATGVGAFLVMVGVSLIASAYFILRQLG
jgi:hypothetical protein